MLVLALELHSLCVSAMSIYSNVMVLKYFISQMKSVLIEIALGGEQRMATLVSNVVGKSYNYHRKSHI